MSIFIDSNIIIKAFVDDKDSEKCRKILNEDFVTNALCLVESQHGIFLISKNTAINEYKISIVSMGSSILFFHRVICDSVSFL